MLYCPYLASVASIWKMFQGKKFIKKKIYGIYIYQNQSSSGCPQFDDLWSVSHVAIYMQCIPYLAPENSGTAVFFIIVSFCARYDSCSVSLHIQTIISLNKIPLI